MTYKATVEKKKDDGRWSLDLRVRIQSIFTLWDTRKDPEAKESQKAGGFLNVKQPLSNRSKIRAVASTLAHCPHPPLQVASPADCLFSEISPSCVLMSVHKNFSDSLSVGVFSSPWTWNRLRQTVNSNWTLCRFTSQMCWCVRVCEYYFLRINWLSSILHEHTEHTCACLPRNTYFLSKYDPIRSKQIYLGKCYRKGATRTSTFHGSLILASICYCQANQRHRPADTHLLLGWMCLASWHAIDSNPKVM